jgi:hypothetical protein
MSYEIPFDNSIFNSRLSFEPLITSLKKTIAEGKPGAQKLYGGLIESFESIPELLQPIDDASALKKYSELVEMLLATIFPPAQSEADNLYAVSFPFTFNTIYTSQLFKHTFLKPGTKQINIPEGSVAYKLFYEKVWHAYYMILRKYAGFKTSFSPRSIYPVEETTTGLRRYLEVQIDSRFVDVKTIDGKEPKIPANAVNGRTNKMMELSELYKLLPLNQFVFEGMVIIRICDVTNQEVISEIKNTLLSTNAFYDSSVYETLQSHIQSLLGLKEVKIGITPFFKVSGHFVYSELHNSNDLLFRHFAQVRELEEADKCCKKLFFESDNAIVFETLNENILNEFHYLNLYYKSGARSLILCPLKHDGEIIGMLEISSETPGKLNALHISKIEDAIPLFTLALEKTAESLETQIDKVIKEKFTAIQPAVEWKFTEVAWNYIQKSRFSEDVKIEKIAFSDVYPLYAAIDIRNSSAERSDAIQLDLIEQLNITGNIIAKAKKEIQFPLFDEVEFKIQKYIQSISDVLLSDEEISIHDFLHGQLLSVFDHLRETLPSVKKDIDDYFALLDPHTGVISHHRKKYEDSITKINNVVSKFIDKEQNAAQKVYPHYFERYVTDGVEFNMYIGQSISPHVKFNDIYLNNLKMWQLSTLAKVARLTTALESELPTLLSTTQLILAHSIPISISFRTAERKFDVDGAYNIRYEIIKKRIDKVRIKETNERLTQPGKIAIVYSQPKEAAEYMEYIEFLQNQKLLKQEIEHLELEELQGVVGLKALRVDVDLDEPVKTETKVELSSTTTSDLLKTSSS